MNIDRIAREMVDVEPSVDLEARIRARLGAVPARTSARWGWMVGAPLAAAAAIALAFVLLQRPGSSVQSPATRVAVQEVQSLPTEAGPVSSTAQAGPVVVSNAAPARAVAKAGQLSAEEIAWMERRLPALDPVNALEMDHLRVDSIQPEPLAITPLTMTPVGTEGAGIERRNDR